MISLERLEKLVRKNLKTGAILGFSMLILSIIYALSLPNYYISRATLLPPDEIGSSSNSMSISDTLGNLTGINDLFDGASSNKILLLESIKSMDFIVDFYKANDLVPFLFAFESRDENGNIEYDDNIYDGKQIIKKSLLFNRKISAEKIYKEATKSIRITEDPIRGVIVLVVETKDREMSQYINNLLLRQLDNFLRKKVKDEANRKITFLEERLSNYRSEVEQNNITTILIKERIKLMNAEISDYYNFKVVDSPSFPERKSKPSRTFIVLFAGVIYLMIMLVIVAIREADKSKS